ncbi:hypothetical protein [Streptomyces sp. NRRL B-24572]|uniref:hypothetical protein n=1 Tax=Streptomyces sp. NRRL B-24572 TaxID=1962156 RepID=UPI000A38CB51|nr:hypothetical protein [Streptomyces sp. NRRL B-24572]
MGNAEKFSQDAVLRARVLLLGSEEPSLRERLGAYRVLAEVSPRAYLPKLVDALVERAGQLGDPELHVALYGEAAAAARRFDADVPERKERLDRALRRYQHALFAVGRRTEGRAARKELVEGRYGALAIMLAEEGRHEEAAELYGRHIVPGEGDDVSPWTLVEWAAELDAAGRQEEALEVFARVVDDHRHRVAEDRGPLASLVWKLERYAGMLLTAGRRAEETAARREALALLARLAEGGEPVSWSDIRAWWTTLLILSDRPSEPAATPDAPLPPFGVHLFHGWSPDTRDDYLASIPALERQAAALRESDDLPGLVVTQRRLTVRRALRWESDGGNAEESLRPSFDEGVTLARRLTTDPGALARALTDRSMFLLAVKRYGEAHADFAEATALQGDAPIVTRT